MGESAKREPKPTAQPTKTSSPTPKPKPPSQKAGSWVHPSPAPGKHLVAKIFFETKRSDVDAQDRALLTELATAYGGSKAAVKGTFDGYADPRPSHDPENEDLSHARASTVARELFHAFTTTSAWYENRGVSGHGVDPAAKTIKAEPGFEDVNAPYRRVDVYLDGKAEPATTTRPEVKDNRPKVPDYSNRPRYWEDTFGYYIERGHKPSISDIAHRIQVQTSGADVDGQLDETLFFLGVQVIKPPWWDARIPAPTHGRGGHKHDPRPAYQQRAMQLLQDYQLYVAYLDERQHDLHEWIEAGFRDHPDKALGARLGHLRFMINQINDDAEAVKKLVDE